MKGTDKNNDQDKNQTPNEENDKLKRFLEFIRKLAVNISIKELCDYLDDSF